MTHPAGVHQHPASLAKRRPWPSNPVFTRSER